MTIERKYYQDNDRYKETLTEVVEVDDSGVIAGGYWWSDWRNDTCRFCGDSVDGCYCLGVYTPSEIAKIYVRPILPPKTAGEIMPEKIIMEFIFPQR
jgi:hypothetical protein